MQTFLKFVKMHALGNDFVIVDRFTHSVYIVQLVIRALGHRKTGIGFDQLLIVEPPVDVDHDFSYQIYNSNGSQAKQCLNGLRCLAHYVNDYGFVKKRLIKFQSGSQSMVCEILSPTVAKTSLFLENESVYHMGYVSALGVDVDHIVLGNEHLICWDLTREQKSKMLNELKVLGFTFDKYNITFANQEEQGLVLETYERGVGRTASCGSAALAAFLAYGKSIAFSSSIRIETQFGYVTAQRNADKFSLIGPVSRVFTGEFLLRYH
jgi:diaminopimelate epimerase